jgi:hypothetical protein
MSSCTHFRKPCPLIRWWLNPRPLAAAFTIPDRNTLIVLMTRPAASATKRGKRRTPAARMVYVEDDTRYNTACFNPTSLFHRSNWRAITS